VFAVIYVIFQFDVAQLID